MFIKFYSLIMQTRIVQISFLAILSLLLNPLTFANSTTIVSAAIHKAGEFKQQNHRPMEARFNDLAAYVNELSDAQLMFLIDRIGGPHFIERTMPKNFLNTEIKRRDEESTQQKNTQQIAQQRKMQRFKRIFANSELREYCAHRIAMILLKLTPDTLQ